MPETLEIIEDYAFAGNQLIGVTIPNNVRHIGNYAFAFNELVEVIGSKVKGKKATIKTIIIKGKEQLDNMSNIGDIIGEDKLKINTYKSPVVEGVKLGPNVKLLDHIWATSMSNIKIEVSINPSFDFYGVDLEVLDGDLETYMRISKNIDISWDGDLSNRGIEIHASTFGSGSGLDVSFINKDGEIIKNLSGKNTTELVNQSTHTLVTKVIVNVPKEAVTMRIIKRYSKDAKLHEIIVPDTEKLR